MAENNNRAQYRRHSSISSGIKRSHSLTSTTPELDNTVTNSNDNGIKQRGATQALVTITKHFGPKMPARFPNLWNSITGDLLALIAEHKNQDSRSTADSKLINNLIVLEVVGEALDESLRSHLAKIYPYLIELLDSKNQFIRHHSSRCIGMISKLMFSDVEDMIFGRIMPMLECDSNVIARCGSIETIAFIIENLQLKLVPKLNKFIVQVLRRLSDQSDQVRLLATHCFGKLLSLMPLDLNKDNGSNKVVKMEEDEDGQSKEDDDENRFIEQLFNPSKLSHYKIPFETCSQMRGYQQDGLNWLAFLNRFNLHGILCDEMGLGKTFMTICMVASDHYNLLKKKNAVHSPSLIVCPATLVEHWLYEIEKFVPSQTRAILNPVSYSGSTSDRAHLRKQILDIFKQPGQSSENDSTNKKRINLVITSYDVLRNDIEFFKTVHWNYCVLDEGHIIKNGKTKLSKAIRLPTAAHRLILSGTPIQNNVTELWSLFDFLMPGFLGSERQFNSRYTKPILLSREPKCSARDLEASALAMESLHRQVLPFILRRLKEDVLDDLPPKIIQDYYCELSPLQSKLYEDFTRSKLCKNMSDQLGDENIDVNLRSRTASHVFQALQYLKNVCNHPKLVLTPKHTQFDEVKKMLELESSNLNDIRHSSKLNALKQLLIDCGIGTATLGGEESSSQQNVASTIEIESVVNQHRALIFCQLRSMTEIIENDLLKQHLPNVTYLKLDGSVPTNQRQSIVSRFNDDPSIDVLLLTTQIGGLGLNLTGADTVIFVEHDWNPTRDLQAMDRAHRIGQKKVVNVYRLITKSTLEEKIMGLQKFKTMISTTVINQDNTGLGTMNVDQLLDLFNDGTTEVQNSLTKDQQGGKNSKSNFIDLLPELWDQQQYDAEYDLSNFVSSLKR